MSEVSDLLWLKAQDLDKEASAKKDEWQMIKSAAVSALSDKGVNASEADGLIDTLAERAYPNLNADLEKAAQLAHIGKILEKAAQYVVELEVKLDNKETEINGLKKSASQAAKAPAVTALSGTGAFTSEDLDALSQLDDGMLNKVAGLADNTPWNIGSPSTRAASGSQDALTEFLLN